MLRAESCADRAEGGQSGSGESSPVKLAFP